MMKIITVIFRSIRIAIPALGLFLPAVLTAQDYIHTVDTKPIAAKVTEIGEEYVIYKTHDNPDGPVYRLSTWKILKIVFENGTEKTFAHIPIRGQKSCSAVPHPWHGNIEYGHGHYYCEHERIRRAQIADYIGYSLYGKEYRSAKKKYIWGFVATCIGAGSLVAGVALHASTASFNRFGFGQEHFSSHPQGPGWQQDNSGYGGVAACYIIGAAGLGAGIPLLVKGQRGLRKIADDYNRTYAPDSKGYSLNIGTTGNGVGLSLNF